MADNIETKNEIEEALEKAEENLSQAKNDTSKETVEVNTETDAKVETKETETKEEVSQTESKEEVTQATTTATQTTAATAQTVASTTQVADTGSPYVATAANKNQMIITDPSAVNQELGKILFEITPSSAGVYSDEIKTINYIKSLFTYFDSLKSSWTSLLSAAKKYQTQTDDAPSPTSGGGSGSSGGGSGSSGGGGTTTTEPGSEITIESITVDDLGVLSDGIMNIANEQGANIEEILANEKLQEDIKKSLIALPLSTELLDKMKDMEKEDLIQFLTNLYNGTNSDMINLDETSKSVIVNYFNTLTNGEVTFANLLTQSDSSVLGDGMKAFQVVDELLEELKTKDGSTISLNLLHIHNGYLTGTNLDENAMNLVRALNETMAKEKGTTVENLLTSGEYNEYIKDKVTTIEPHFSYLSAVSNTSNSNIQKVMGKLNIKADIIENETSTYPDVSYEDVLNTTDTPQNV